MAAGHRPTLTKYGPGDVLGKWTLVEFIDRGGNADVWQVKAGSRSAALKLLHRTDPEGYARFCREVEICESTDPAAVAILPVLDSHLPDNPRRDRPWFAMPIAKGAAAALAGRPLDEKVAAIRDIAVTLAYLLEAKGINHRDVKPENFYLWNGRAVIGDFGLAKRPEDPKLTTKVIGPYHHLPDEAFDDPNPNRELIDVYCLANSLWRLVVEAEDPPRGQIRATDSKSIALLLPNEPYISRLASLIEAATSTAPARRPSLAVLADQLTDWLASRSNIGQFEADFEAGETRRLAVLRWLIDFVRREPVWEYLLFQQSDDGPQAMPVVPGFSYAEAARSLVELIEEGFVAGDAEMFRDGVPAYISNLYPTPSGLRRLEELDAALAQAAPLLRAFLEPADIVLPGTSEVVDAHVGVRNRPAEVYFEIRLLSDLHYLEYSTLRETMGTSYTLDDVHTTLAGQRWLYELDAEARQQTEELQTKQIAAVRASLWILAGEPSINDDGVVVTYESNLGNSGQGVARNVSLHLIDDDGHEYRVVPVPDLGQPSVLIDVVLPTDHPTLSARLVWDDGTGDGHDLTIPDVYAARSS